MALRDIVGRLAAGSRGRTEADVQADVRAFLLEAPFELVDDQVVDVALEAQAGSGRRIDVEAGCAVIEVKKSLRSTSVFAEAVRQLARYVKQRTEVRAQRYVGVLTDGQLWVLFHMTPAAELSEVSRFVITGGQDGLRLAAWLEPVLATNEKIKPTPKEIRRRLGAASAAAQLDLADLRALYLACRADPEVRLKRELWARLLLSALGTNFDNSDELFVTHTYLVLTAGLLAHEVMGIHVNQPDADVRALLEGQQFEVAGLHGVVEADFFDWPASVPSGAPIIRGIARRLSQFAWSDVEHDILKVLYESIIDSRTRKRLGEYYTPDWLAQKIVDEQFADPRNDRILDPACGSGTFLFWAVRRAIAACEEAGMTNRETVAHVVSHVFGMDLHPVAVTLARVTYLLAITPERIRQADRTEITVPVFLGDSVRWEQDDTIVSAGGITVHTSDELELFEQDLHFPEGVVETPARFDRLVAALARKAAQRTNRGVPKIGGLLSSHHVEDPQDRAAVELAFTKLCRLHDAGRDHLWGYYIRNLARPLSFTRSSGRVDVVVGNPPWLAFRHMPPKLQATYQSLAEPRGMWAGGRNAPNQDLSDLFVARAVEQYLKEGGRFSFVMPHAVLSRFAYGGFRTGSWSAYGASQPTRVSFSTAEDFSRVKPALFTMPACVVAGEKGTSATPLAAAGVSWSGRVPGDQLSWCAAQTHLVRTDAATELATRGRLSPYRTRFQRGATLFPRVLLKVVEQPAGPLGAPAGRSTVTSSRAAVEKEPWRSLPSLHGCVEREFIRRTHLGASIVSFRAREPELAVVPWLDGELLDGDHERLDEFPGLAAWWREAERLWNAGKATGNKLTLRDRIDFQRGVSGQMPVARHRVVYTNSGQYLSACRIDDPTVLVEQTLLWAAVETPEEAQYLCAIFNSDALAEVVTPLQARGQHNPRHFAMSLFAIPFPLFDAANDLHAELATLAQRAEHLVDGLDLDGESQFQTARRKTREALRKDGVAAEIDAAVVELISSTAAGGVDESEPMPDLMGVISEALEVVRRRTGGRKRPPRPEPTVKQQRGARFGSS